MKRHIWIGVGALLGALGSASAQTAQVGLRSDGSYVQPPIKLSGTLICRGGSELLFEGPRMHSQRRADRIPPGKTVTTADLVTYVEVPIRSIIFQSAPGAAGKEGVGLRPSQCSYQDRARGAFPPNIFYDAATEEFEITSSGNAPFSRRSTVREYLSDVNHFWAFDVVERGFYYEAKAHRRFDVTLLADAGTSGQANVGGVKGKAMQPAAERPTQQPMQQSPQQAAGEQPPPSVTQPVQPVTQSATIQRGQQPINQPFNSPTAAPHTEPIVQPKPVDPSSPIVGSAPRDPGAGQVIAKLFDVRVMPELNAAGFRFTARPNAVPVVEISKEAPVPSSSGQMSIRNPVLRFSPTRDNRNSSPSVTIYIGQSLVSSGVRLQAHSIYHYLITVPDVGGGTPAQQAGSFTTASREVTVTFTQIYILSDSDDDGEGDLAFYFHAQPEGDFVWESGGVTYFNAESGTRRRIEKHILLFDPTDRVTVAVTGEDDDDLLGAYLKNRYEPARRPSRTSTEEVNVARGVIDLTSREHGFTLRSVGPGPHGSRLFFEASGYFEIQERPGRVLSTP